MSIDRIYKRLFSNKEVNLKSEVVELATLKSTIAAVDKAYKLKEKADSISKKAKDAIIDALNSYSDAISAFELAKKESLDIESKAKELGLALPSETQSLLKNMERENSQAVEGKSKFSSIKF